MIVHIPHSSRLISAEYTKQFVVSDARLQHEMNVMVDSFTDELFEFDCADENVRTIVFPVCRLLVDPERFADDSLEAMSKKGMGVLYSKTYKGGPLRRRLDEEERRELLEKYYFPHQKSVSDAVREEFRESGSSLVLDGHSFPSRPLPCHDDQTEPTPDFLPWDRFISHARKIDGNNRTENQRVGLHGRNQSPFCRCVCSV